MAEKSGVRKNAYSSDHELSSDFVEGPKWKGSNALKKDAKDQPIRKIKVTKLPDGAVEETLMNYFENMQHNGGGPIENIEYHPATSSAIIEFQKADAVDRVLKKRPMLFLKRQISVEEYVEKVEEVEEGPSSHTVEVHGFVENTSEDVLEMYFENSKRSGGGEVTSVVIEGDVALVTFTDKNVASSVCEREHKLSGRLLSVSLHLPKKKSSAMETEIEESEDPVCTVEVRGYKLGSEGTIELYFENTNRSGGDEIVNFDPITSDGVIFITFASEEVAKRVSERHHIIAGCTLDVKLYEPPKRKSTRKWSKICSKQPVPHCVIAVRGVTRRIIEAVPLYFENKRRSGGDEIVKFEYKEENGIAYITYESEEVAQRVVTHGQHKLEGQPLKVKLFIPPQPRPHYEDRVLFVRLTSKITRDGLTNFFEAKIGLTPADFFFGEEGDKVIIRFNEKIDFQKLEEACKKRTLEGSYLQPSKVPVSNCILVSNLKNTTTVDTIELYFENEKRSWGGPVEKVEFSRGQKYCLVYFEDHTLCEQVLQRKHKLDGSDLQVSVYYECLGRISEDHTGPCFKPRKPVKLEGLEFPKMNFECKSFEPNWLSPEKNLQDCHTQIELSQTLMGFMAPTFSLSSNVQVVTKNEEDEPVRKIKVTKLPEETTEDTLMNYFENRRRSGGGPIESIELHPATSSAIIEFKEADAVDRVLKRAPLLFLKKQISVEEYIEEVEEEEEPSCRTIEVRGFAENTLEEVLEIYFGNTKRSGGGDVTSVVIEGGVALVTFSDENVVSSVLQREHTVDGQLLTVTLHLPKKKPPAMEVEEEEDEPLCTVEVRGYKTVSEDTLQMYFENTKRSGGGEVVKFEKIDMDQMIFITFASEEAARNVSERKHVVGGCNLNVKLYEPPKRKSTKNLSRTTSEEPEESEPHCTVEVRGVTNKILGTLQLYFENTKRSGGDEIVHFEHKEADEIAYITFQSEDVAKRVVSHGQHKVEGQTLEVKLYIPPPPRPIYNDRVLLTGFTSKVTQDGLTNFLEAKTGLTPVKYVYAEEEGKVIITFAETLDFEKLEEACKKRPLEGSYLVPSKVYVSNSIIISNLKITTTEDTIQLYFENEKRSWGGPVEKVEFKREEEYCLVFFEDHTICDRVLQRKHKIDGSELQVSIYYESLGRISEYDNGPSFKPPKALKLEGLEFVKIQFLMKSEPNRTALEKQLQDCFTQIQWPQTEKDCTTLTCTLTSDVQDCKKKALTWAKQAEQNLHDFLKVISVNNLNVFQEIFETVLQNLQTLTIKNPDGVAVFVKNAEFSIQVVGHKAVATGVVKDIEDIIKKAEAEFDRKKKQTKETLTTLKYYQLRLLLAQKYPIKTEKQFNGLKVKININKNEIVFEGLMEDIRIAKVVMYEKIHNAAVSQLKNVSEGRLFLYKSKEVKDYIVAKLKSNKLVGVWDVEGSKVNIYADSDEAVVQSAHIINDSVKEHQRDLQTHQRSVVQSQQWNDKMKDLDKQNQGKLHIILGPDFSKIFLYFTDDILGAVCEEVDDFLSRNTILETVVACDIGKIQLIGKKENNEVDKIAKDLAHFYVQITIQSKGGFLVRGNQEGINQATYRLQELIKKVQHRDHELNKPGIAQYMESKGRQHISAVANQIPCVILLKGQDQYGLGKNEEETDRFDIVGTGGSGPAILAECRSFGLEKIFSALGDITEIDADVLVNAADPKLEHRGGVAKAIVDKGGKVIREECIQHVRKHGHLAEGEIHVTSAGSLRAKIIIHAVSPVWKGGHDNEQEVLREAIFTCMETTAKKRLKSIAIPALGSGVFGCPAKQSTKVIVEAVRDFFREDQESSISEVYLSDINPETVRCFTEALENSYGKQSVTEVKQKPTPKPRNMKAFPLPGAVAVLPRMPFNTISSKSSGFGKISISVVKGEMASQKVDVMVNTAAKSLDLTHGAVSQSLLKHGGQTLQDECKLKYPNGIKDGDIAVTGGGHLSCKRVCHVALMQWKDETTSLKMLHGLMKKCLDECNKNGFASIAFPALGTGNLGYPKDIVAKEMFQHISTYSSDNPSSSITEVRFVVYQKDLPTVQAFESEQQKWSGNVTRAGRRTSQHTQQEESSVYSSLSVSVPAKEEAMDTEDSSGFADGFAFGKIDVKIYQGDITQEDADCIVNSSNEDFDLSKGAVSVAIMKKGLKPLADECKARADDMKKNGIAVTTGYGLNCKHVIHIVAVDTNKWTPIINKCLLKAEELKAKSIAFPALGTGVGVSPEEIAKVMFSAITDFQASGAKTVTEVRIVIFQSQMVQVFVNAARNLRSGAKQKSIFGRIYSSFTGGNDEQVTRKVPLKSPQATRPVEQPSTVWIDVYAWEKQSLDAAIKKLDNLIKNDFNEAKFTESVIKTFSPDQVSKLQKLGQQWGTQIAVDTKNGKITIEGVSDGVIKVSDGIHRLIREADKKEQDKRSAELLKKLVQWHYIEITTESSELRAYPADVNLLIETAYKDQKPSVTFFTNEGEEYKIEFRTMEEFSIKDPSDTVTVVRKDLIQEMGFSELPSTWAKMAPNENFKVVNLQSTDKEYQDVQQKFLLSVGGTRTIVKLERIQNRTLYQQYESKKKLIEQNNPGHQNESSLWHGTSADSVDSISMHGFNRSYCGKNATAYGDGVYFAKNASYSANDTYSKPDPSGNKKMYLCRVLTGQYTTGQKGMRVPPPKSGGKANELYDSVVDNISNPGMFIIFNDTQAIPEYLITFK